MKQTLFRGASALAARTEALVYPRRCPFCGRLLGAQTLCCADCAGTELELRHLPPRLPDTEHHFYAVSGAAGAYYYAGAAAQAILAAKNGGKPWYARELADLAAVRVFGAETPARPGALPQYDAVPGVPLFDAIVPVPPRSARRRGIDLPGLLAARLGSILQVPVMRPLAMRPGAGSQQGLRLQQRLKNRKNAYRMRPGALVEGKRLLLVDDVITTGATVSACAQTLMEAGAVSVFAVCVAADEALPKGVTL